MAATAVAALTAAFTLGRMSPIVVPMAAQGWVFDNWVYRGSAQAPDLLFHRK